MPRPGAPIARVQGGYKNALGLLRSVTQPDFGAALPIVTFFLRTWNGFGHHDLDLIGSCERPCGPVQGHVQAGTLRVLDTL